MIVATTQRAIGFVIAAVVAIGFIAWLVAQHPGRSQGGRLRDRARRRTASPISPTRSSRVRSSTSRCSRPPGCSPSSPSPCRCTGWASPAGRRAPWRRPRRSSSSQGPRHVRERRPVRELPRRRRASAGSLRSSSTTRTASSSPRSTGRHLRSTTSCTATTTDQVRYILNYGRPGTPMAAWGAHGGGPLTTQQIDNVIDYLWSVQLSPKQTAQAGRRRVKQIDPQLYDRTCSTVRSTNRRPRRNPRRPTGCPMTTS